MIADTTFRFVSVRPPQRQQDVPSTRLEPPAKAPETLKTYIAEVQTSSSSPEKTAEAVSEKILKSSDYYTSNVDWKPLLEEAQGFQSILRAAVQSRDPDLFTSRLSDALKSVLGEEVTLVGIAQSERFHDLKTNIWLSYYANVLSSKPVPGSQREILDWIRFLSLVEAIDNDELLQTRLLKYHRMRPSLPASLLPLLSKQDKQYKGKQGVVKDTRNEGREAAAIKRFKEKLSKQQKARAELVAILREKLAEGRRLAKDRQMAKQESAAIQHSNDEIRKKDIGVRQSPPWHLEEQDLRGREDLRLLMDEMQVDPDLSTLPQLIQQLDRAIASCKSRLIDLKSEEVIISVGRTFARVKRRKA